MKTNNLFLLTLVLFFGVVFQSSGQNNVVLTTTVTSPGKENTMTGFNSGISLQNLPDVLGNSFFGAFSGRWVVGPNSENNTYIGYQAGAGSGPSENVGSGNSFLGASAGNQIQAGYENVFIGMNSGFKNTNGNWNSFLGTTSGLNNTTGNEKLFFWARRRLL